MNLLNVKKKRNWIPLARNQKQTVDKISYFRFNAVILLSWGMRKQTEFFSFFHLFEKNGEIVLFHWNTKKLKKINVTFVSNEFVLPLNCHIFTSNVFRLLYFKKKEDWNLHYSHVGKNNFMLFGFRLSYLICFYRLFNAMCYWNFSILNNINITMSTHRVQHFEFMELYFFSSFSLFEMPKDSLCK